MPVSENGPSTVIEPAARKVVQVHCQDLPKRPKSGRPAAAETLGFGDYLTDLDALDRYAGACGLLDHARRLARGVL